MRHAEFSGRRYNGVCMHISGELMSTRIEDLVQQAKSLTAEEQAILAEKLYEMVNPPDSAWESAWVRECEDRIAAYDRGEMTASDSHDMIERLRKKHGLG